MNVTCQESRGGWDQAYLGGEGRDGGVGALGQENDAVEPVEHGVARLAVVLQERVLKGLRQLALLLAVLSTCWARWYK